MAHSVPILKSSGQLGKRKVDPECFRRRGSRVLLKEFVIMAEARARVGTHATLSRSQVSGTTAKMYRQKGTGHARHGSRKACQLRGGGHAFNKRPREYGWSMPKKARRAALEAAIRGKLDDGEVRLVQDFGIKKPRTKDFTGLVGRLELEGTILIVPAVHSDALWRSCRNVTGCSYTVVSDINAYQVLRSRYLILEDAALKTLEERFADG